jgi:hypothetical protein
MIILKIVSSIKRSIIKNMENFNIAATGKKGLCPFLPVARDYSIFIEVL